MKIGDIVMVVIPEYDYLAPTTTFLRQGQTGIIVGDCREELRYDHSIKKSSRGFLFVKFPFYGHGLGVQERYLKVVCRATEETSCKDES